MRELVYICSPLKPYGNKTEKQNIDKANIYCRLAYEQGHTPLAPHTIFTQFLSDSIAQERIDAMEMGQEILRNCQQLWVCGNYISDGMASEIALAKQWGIPIKQIHENSDGKIMVVMFNGRRYV